MAYPFTTITQLRTFITDTFTANGVRSITGPDGHDALLGILDLIPPALQAQLIAQLGSGGSVGGVNNGDIFPIGTTLEDVLIAILTKTIHPTYVLPTSLLSTNVPTLNQEVGAVISPTLSEVFIQNDGGLATLHQLTKNGVNLSAVLPYVDSAVTIGNTPIAYQIATSYAQGACKNNNLGVLDCNGRVITGIAASNIILYTGYRKVFFGTPAATPTTSANVRALAGSSLNPIVGSQFPVTIATSATRVVIAYPASLPDVTLISYREMGGIDVTANFVKTTVNVEGANAFATVSYKVFTYVPVEPFTSGVHYDVTI